MAISRLDIRGWRPPASDRKTVNKRLVGEDYLTLRQRASYAKRYQAGDDSAGERLLSASMGQVYSAAVRYSGRGIPIDDLVQEGCMGVLHTAKIFDPKKGLWFSSVVKRQINYHIEKAIEERDKTFGTLQPHPNMDAFPLIPSISLTYDPNQTVSINGVKIPRILAKVLIEQMLSRLRPKQEQVIRLRYGLFDGDIRTLDEVGDTLKVTKERVRQIEAHALRSLAARWRRLSQYPWVDYRPPSFTSKELSNIRYSLRTKMEKKEYRMIVFRLGFSTLTRHYCYSIEDTCKKFKVTEEDIKALEKKAPEMIDDPVIKSKIYAYFHPERVYKIENILHNLPVWQFIFA